MKELLKDLEYDIVGTEYWIETIEDENCKKHMLDLVEAFKIRNTFLTKLSEVDVVDLEKIYNYLLGTGYHKRLYTLQEVINILKEVE